MAYPMFVAGINAQDSLGRIDVVEVGGDITSGVVAVSHGDLVLADDNGVVVVPFAVAQEAIGLAEERSRLRCWECRSARSSPRTGSCERRGAGDQPRRAFANKAGERAASRPRDVHHSSVRITPVRPRRLLIDQYWASPCSTVHLSSHGPPTEPSRETRTEQS